MTKDLGLKTVRDVASKACVIFVHGVLSSSEKGWSNDTGTSWPKLLMAEPKLSDLSIFTFEYQSDLWSKDYSLDDVADALKETLRTSMPREYDHIAFVCHSMGGIIVRRLLVNATHFFDKMIVGLFLVASPSLGSGYADFIAPLGKLFGHAHSKSLRTVEHNPWLKSLDKDFYNLKEGGQIRIIGKELIEDKLLASKKWVWFKQVVTYFSANRYFGEALKIPGSDHITIAKPLNQNSLQHRVLTQFLSNLMAIDIKNSKPQTSVQFESAIAELEDLRGLPMRIVGILPQVGGLDFTNLARRIFESEPTPSQSADLQASLGKLMQEGAIARHSLYGDRYILAEQAPLPLGSSNSPVWLETLGSDTWFQRIVEQLRYCGYARIYLHSFDHPDDFRTEHRDQLMRIMNELKNRIEAGCDIKVISYTPSNKKTGVDWLRDATSNKERVNECFKIRQTQRASNASSLYLFDDRSLIFSVKSDNGRTYHVQKNQKSILHEALKLGVEKLFEDKS